MDWTSVSHPLQLFCVQFLRSGNFLIIGGCTAAIVGSSWGGVIYPWNSPRVLIICLVVQFVALFYEAKVPKEPTIPFILFKNRTSLLGLVFLDHSIPLLISLHRFVTTVLRTIRVSVMSYNLPVYFQACKLASALQSGIESFWVAFSVASATIAMSSSVNIA